MLMTFSPNLSDWIPFVTPLFQISRPSHDLVLAICVHYFRCLIHSVLEFTLFQLMAITEDNAIMWLSLALHLYSMKLVYINSNTVYNKCSSHFSVNFFILVILVIYVNLVKFNANVNDLIMSIASMHYTITYGSLSLSPVVNVEAKPLVVFFCKL